MWSVIVIARDPQQNAMFALGADTTMAEVRRRWQETLARPTGSIFRRSDRTRLSDRQRLTEVGEVSPGCRTVNVLVEEAIEVTVQLYKSETDTRRSMAVGLSEKPEDIHGEVRAMFGLEEDRLFRLRARDAPLKYNRTFGEQEIEEGGALLVDVGFELDVMDEWSSSVETRLMFASEDAAVLESETSAAQRLLLGGVAMELGSDILDALPRDYRRMPQIFVQRQQQRDITAMVNGFLRRRLVWPTDLTGTLIENCPPLTSELFFEEERLPRDATWKEAKLPDNAVVHTVTRVPVKGSDGKRRVVRLPDMATVADLEAAVSGTEGTPCFSLRCGGRLLERSDAVAKVLIDGRSIEVERHGDAVTVCLPDRCVRFRREQRRMTFTQVMEKVAEKGALELKALADRTLQCQGCGRKLTQAEEAFQAIPADCCRVRSLQLAEPTPAVTRDAGTQGPCPNAGGRVRRKRVGERRRGAEAAQQTERRMAPASLQHPLSEFASPSPRPFRVFNDRGLGDGGKSVKIHGEIIHGHAFNTDLLLSDAPTAGQVRAAVAAELSVSPATVNLWQRVGRRKGDGKTVFNVFDDHRRPGDQFGFADVAGTWTSGSRVKWEVKELQDADPFSLVSGFRSFVFVLCR